MVLTNTLFKVMYSEVYQNHTTTFSFIHIYIYIYMFIHTHNHIYIYTRNLSVINIQYCQFSCIFWFACFQKNMHSSLQPSTKACDGNGNATGASNMDQPYGGSYPYVSWVKKFARQIASHISTRWTPSPVINGLESLRNWPKING